MYQSTLTLGEHESRGPGQDKSNILNYLNVNELTKRKLFHGCRELETNNKLRQQINLNIIITNFATSTKTL